MKVSIRGMGLICALGDSPERFADGVFGGRVALGPSAALEGVFAGEISGFHPRAYIAQKGLQILSRSALLATAALSILRKCSTPHLEPGEFPEKIGLVVGTAFGHIESKARFSEEAVREGVTLVSPILFPNTIINSLGGHAAIVHGWRGPNSTLAAGARSSLEAIRYAAELLLAGRAERVAAVGCDEVSLPLLEGLRARGLLARKDPSGPDASIPATDGRSGIYPAEASAALLLMKAEASGLEEAPAPPVLAQILGSGSASSVRRGIGGAARRAMEIALADSGLAAADIGWVALSASGSKLLDGAEAEAVRHVLGGAIPAAALKRQCGETFGAGGILAAIAAIFSLKRREIPPTPGAVRPLLPGLSPDRRSFSGPPAVLVSAVDEDGATAVVVAAA